MATSLEQLECSPAAANHSSAFPQAISTTPQDPHRGWMNAAPNPAAVSRNPSFMDCQTHGDIQMPGQFFDHSPIHQDFYLEDRWRIHSSYTGPRAAGQSHNHMEAEWTGDNSTYATSMSGRNNPLNIYRSSFDLQGKYNAQYY